MEGDMKPVFRGNKLLQRYQPKWATAVKVIDGDEELSTHVT